MKPIDRERRDARNRLSWLHRIAVLLVISLLGAPGLAVPKEGTPGERCAQLISDKNRRLCCVEAHDQCVSRCPSGPSGPNAQCRQFCESTVLHPCLKDVTAQVGRPGSPAPAPGGTVTEPRPRGRKAGRAAPRAETPVTARPGGNPPPQTGVPSLKRQGR